jgi:hypothetical protein
MPKAKTLDSKYTHFRILEVQMIAEQDFNQIQKYIVQILPQLLHEKPEIVSTIEGIIADNFPRRDEFARLLDEVKEQREQTNRHLDQMDLRFTLLREEMEQRLELQRKEMDQRFDLLQAEMNERFEQVDKRFDLLHTEMKGRFQQVEQRLDRVDQQFDNVDQRFDKVDQQLQQGHRESFKIKRRLLKVEASQDTLIKKVTGLETWLKMATGNLGTEKGQTLEDMFAIALSYGLNNPDIKAKTILLRQGLVDDKGVVFKKDYFTEIDLISENGRLTVFEVKATAKVGDVDFFSWKVELVQVQNPNKQVHGAFISLGASEEVRQRCTSLGIEFLD